MTETGKFGMGMGWAGRDDEFSIGYVALEMTLRRPVGNIQWAVGDVGLKLKGETGAGYLDLGVICRRVIIKLMEADEVTERKKRRPGQSLVEHPQSGSMIGMVSQ